MDLIRHLDLSDMWLGVDLRTKLKKEKRHALEREWTTYSKYADQSRLKRRGVIRLLNEHENLHLGKCTRYSYELQHIRGERLQARFGFYTNPTQMASFISYKRIIHLYQNAH